MVYYDIVDSPVGALLLAVDGAGAAVRVAFLGTGGHEQVVGDLGETTPSLEHTSDVRRQLTEYFAGRRRSFALRLAPVGTPFQRRVWDEVRRIPYGQVSSYADLAARLGLRNGERAVGQANAANPLPILVPCHRVVGSHGELTGFGGGLEAKAFLLRLEKAPVPAAQLSLPLEEG
ncbi:MAG: methylated-DNA--[protein]-cysteine S-methyltransferase [Acidobacteria bacterium]|nr:methylated-DNA--[protein]-cysteine S-methyltransferase [Acidobacteriota bacterium]